MLGPRRLLHWTRSCIGRACGRLRRGVVYVSEPGGWSIHHDATSITGALRTLFPEVPASVTLDPTYCFHQIVHYGSLWVLRAMHTRVDPSNIEVATIFHGKDGLSPEMDAALDVLRAWIPRCAKIITACEIMRSRLLGWGATREQVEVIPIGVDLRNFTPATAGQKQAIRQKLGIPQDAFVIGSFQKDGEGWGEGMNPKRIKGPDILVETLRLVHQKQPVFVLLTGPARGYVKEKLSHAGIPHLHQFLENYADLPSYYHALDAYLVPSREEGGPKALPESMASGIPIVTTRVGMAPEMVRHEETGLLHDQEDAAGLAHSLLRLVEQKSLREILQKNSLTFVHDYDISSLANLHYQRVYLPILSSSRLPENSS